MIELSENTSLQELQSLSFWKNEEIIQSSSPAGPSNMNLVLRIQTSRRNVILKQSKSYVRKFPQIPAPIERINVEYEFLKLLENHPQAYSMIPKILDFDPQNHMLLMEDLGIGKDFSGIYSHVQHLSEQDISTLVGFLNILHGIHPQNFPKNLEMRMLNHEHIFRFPFMEENGFDLDTIQPGLQKLSLEIKQDKSLKERIEALGKRYLAEGDTLLHGDFYPGSWLGLSSGVKVIDPEFAFRGDREFDLGVLLAHLDLGQQGDSLENLVLASYQHSFQTPLLNGYRGVEILRRLIGIAQLPVALTLSQ
ncbi:MAG: phosphotransferase, partial [Cyclobacteriaceae bacterium]|nr:phosphotransferase [Cyclobacteriaceae bacterium]MDX5465872.1 phosphotransferase [Cyclobacteriaceae bacterium]